MNEITPIRNVSRIFTHSKARNSAQKRVFSAKSLNGDLSSVNYEPNANINSELESYDTF